MKYKILILALCSLAVLASQNASNRNVTITNYVPDLVFTAYYKNHRDNNHRLNIPSQYKSSIETTGETIVLAWNDSRLVQNIPVHWGNNITIKQAIAFEGASGFIEYRKLHPASSSSSTSSDEKSSN